MSCQEENPLSGENLVTLEEAAKDFGGVSISLSALRKYTYA
jgi:predicted metalloendopeptidase